MESRIDFSRYVGSEEVVRNLDPKRELRTPADLQRTPDFFQRGRERDGDSSFSGGNMGGGIWNGRSR
jgi:hypothetical protein